MAWFKFGQKDGDTVRAAQTPVQSIEAMRQRAKHRLLGTTVLVVAGIIGFPMLFDSQPRPVSVDVPIEIPDKAKAKPLTIPPLADAPVPAARVEDTASLGGKEEIVSSKPASAKKEEKPAVAVATSAQAAPKSVVPGAVAGAAAVAVAGAAGALALKDAAKAPVDEAAKTKAADAAKEKDKQKEAVAKEAKLAQAAKDKDTKDKDAARAKALLEGNAPKTETKVAAAAAAAPAAAHKGADTRYIVQFGAFAEADKAQEARNTVEKAGLKTYSQITETAQGKRIRVRVGPFTSKDEADSAASKIKTLGLQASILTL